MPAPYLSTALTLTQATTNVRQDLSDTDASDYRWVDAVIQREIDRALDAYSYAAPFFQLTQVATTAYSKLYACPSGSWWIDRVEYPTGRWPKCFQPFKERPSPLIADPTATTGSLLFSPATGGSITGGAYQYAYTFTVPGSGETKPSPAQSVTLSANAQNVLTVPTGPYGVTGRNIYRTAAGGGQLKLAGSIPDNLSSSFTDSIADASLGVNAPSTNTTQGIPQFEIQLSPYYIPQDALGWIEITYASKHLLDATGTTIPEEHWDALHLGAEALLAQQYVAAVNDNFDWVDGQFRDRVDDTKSITAWQTYAADLTTRFEQRLKQIQAQDNDTISNISRWGDKPYRWDRL